MKARKEPKPERNAFIAGTGLKLVAAIWMICLVWSDTYPVVKNWIVTTF